MVSMVTLVALFSKLKPSLFERQSICQVALVLDFFTSEHF